ncbi:hypothetical protein FBR02_03480 [Anaerolineae bacterium CFX9]|jgi:tetratricopeptide (TPR) repeat protein|nr:hypothetical protein [Anaerolineae bacterium CFX9]
MARTHLDLADAYIRAGELYEALAALTQHLDDEPGDDAARRTRIAVRARLRDPESITLALADLDALTAPGRDDHVQRAILLEGAGDLAGADAAVRRALALQPEDDALIERRLRLLQALHQAEEGLALVEQVLERDPRWIWFRWQGDLLVSLRRFHEAAAAFGRGLDDLVRLEQAGGASALLTSQRAQMLLQRADARRQARLFQAADDDYAAAEQLIPDDPMIPFMRGLMLFAAQDSSQTAFRKALPICRDALDRANAALSEQMRNALLDDPLYHPLAQALVN